MLLVLYLVRTVGTYQPPLTARRSKFKRLDVSLDDEECNLFVSMPHRSLLIPADDSFGFIRVGTVHPERKEVHAEAGINFSGEDTRDRGRQLRARS